MIVTRARRDELIDLVYLASERGPVVVGSWELTRRDWEKWAAKEVNLKMVRDLIEALPEVLAVLEERNEYPG